MGGTHVQGPPGVSKKAANHSLGISHRELGRPCGTWVVTSERLRVRSVSVRWGRAAMRCAHRQAQQGRGRCQDERVAQLGHITASGWEHPRARWRCHVQPFDPRYWQPMSLDTDAPLASVSAAHLYTMPRTGSVNAAVDLDEGLKYLSSLLRSAPDGVQPHIRS